MKTIKHKALPEGLTFSDIGEALASEIEDNSNKKSFFWKLEETLRAYRRMSHENTDYSVECHADTNDITGESTIYIQIKMSESVSWISAETTVFTEKADELLDFSVLTNKSGYLVVPASEKEKAYIVIERISSKLSDYSYGCSSATLLLVEKVMFHSVNPKTKREKNDV